MKTELRNGKVAVINETFEDSLETFNYFLSEVGQPAVNEKTARMDFGIVGGETNAELQEWARDYASECHTEKCESKNQWRYQY